MLKRGGRGRQMLATDPNKLATRMVAQIWGFLGNAAQISLDGGAA